MIASTIHNVLLPIVCLTHSLIASILGLSNVIVCLSTGTRVVGASGKVEGVDGLSKTCVGTLTVVEGSYNLNVGVVTTTPPLGANVGA